MAAPKKIKLVLCIDRDNDLFEKAGIAGPVIGREANLNAAIKFSLADPTEPDANSIYKAITVYDSLSKEHNCEIATLTGNKGLGYRADKEISEQLERVLAEFPADSCVFVSDGASDEQIMPIIRSRLKIDSVEILVMKQAKELEQTYFVILEKLKDPYYARLIFGIPALILILFAITRYLNFGIESLALLIGAYLMLRSFGVEEWLAGIISRFEFSVERISLIVYFGAIPIFLASLWFGYQAYAAGSASQLDFVKMFAKATKSVLVALPWAVLLIITGKVIDLLNVNRRVDLTRYGLYAISTVLFWLIFSVAADWVLNDAPPYVSFGDFAFTILASIVIAFFSIQIMRGIKVNAITHLKLDNKEIFEESGSYVGKVMGVDAKNSSLVVRSPLGQRLTIGLDSVTSVGDRIMVRY
jgi:putative membrane protein